MQNNETHSSQTNSNGGNYAPRRPIEETRVFKSQDGRSIVVQNIKTSIFPFNYIHTIVKNESPRNNKSNKGQAAQDE